MNEVTIKAGDLEVIASGSTIAVPGKTLEFALKGDANPMVLRIVATTDSANKAFRHHFNVVGQHEMEITLFNVDPLGAGNTQPIELGTFNGRRLFFSYRTFALQDAGNLFFYCWYLGGKALNG